MNRHASPYQPSNGALTRTRQRYQKGSAMRKTMLGIMGSFLCLASIIGVMAVVDAKDGNPSKTGYVADDGCWFDAGGFYQCPGSPIASPVPVVTPTPIVVEVEPTTVIDTIIQLPATGAGTTAHNARPERAHWGWHRFYRCAIGYMFYQDRWAEWHYLPAYGYYMHYWDPVRVSSWHWTGGYC